jgi:transposase
MPARLDTFNLNSCTRLPPADLASQGQALMTLDQNHLGIDVSKAHLDLFEDENGRYRRIANTPAAVAQLAADLAGKPVLVVLEATGTYDRHLRLALLQAGIAHVRVNPSRARDFARAAGLLAKTDRIDARMLAMMGKALQLQPRQGPTDARERLTSLVRRRDQLVALRATEKNHAESADEEAGVGIARHVAWLDAEIATLEAAIQALISACPNLAATSRRLRSAPGIGPVAATVLIALLPELGTRSGKTLAALAGLAPLNRDSGIWRGKRTIGPGRHRVRKALYMAAVSAIRSKTRLADFYKSLRSAGKPAKLALIAVARKLLTMLNAMERDAKPFVA